MDKNIVQTVYSTLEEATKDLTPTRDELEALEGEIRSGRYSSHVMQHEIYPKRDALKSTLQGKRDAAISKAHALVAQYRQDAAELDNLDPADLTDDIKLFQSGIVLLSRDIEAVLKRNAGNRTMTQIALRYAKEHDIDMKGTFYIGGEAERQNADNLDTLIRYYERWIDKENALQMLDAFFHPQQ